MARKDEIFKTFLQHEILQEKYGLRPKELPNTIREGLNSDSPIVKAIALIVDNLENSTPTTDKVLHNTITQLLNSSTI
jgi:hypothetical protein